MHTHPVSGSYIGGKVLLDEIVTWSDGTRLSIEPKPSSESDSLAGPVIIAGFGLAGRCIAELLDARKVKYTVIERNPSTVATQRSLGRHIVEGDVSEAATLLAAGLHDAGSLALTIPDENAVLAATSVARKLRPDIYIIARTNYSSKGMQASQLGADDVIKAEQAVAAKFYEKLSRRF